MGYTPRTADQPFLGFIFTKNRGKYFFQPSLMVGFSEFKYRVGSAKAKKLGSNELFFLDFSPENEKIWGESPGFLAGLKTGYFFAKRWAVCASTDFTAIHHRLKYDFTQTNEIEKTTETVVISFKNWQFSGAAQAGLFFFF